MTCEIPPDYDPDDLWYKQIIAEIRHGFTNYERLLEELPLCVDHVAGGGECVWDTETGLECSLAEEAHKIIKWAAIRVVRAEFESWHSTDETWLVAPACVREGGPRSESSDTGEYLP